MAAPSDDMKGFLSTGRVARLATAGVDGKPLVIPICYAYDGERLFTPIDKKPKSVEPGELRRVRNILQNPKVSVVVDRYSEDWQGLGYVVIEGRAEILSEGEEYARALRLLEEKYPQYREMRLREAGLPVIEVTPLRYISWGRLGV